VLSLVFGTQSPFLTSLYPLFPGANELDQINKIHDIVGTPPAHVLAKIRKNSQHMNMKFPDKRGKGECSASMPAAVASTALSLLLSCPAPHAPFASLQV